MKKRLQISLLFILLIAQNSIAQLGIEQIIEKNLEVTGFDKGQIHRFIIKGALIQNQTKMDLEIIGVLPNNMLMRVTYNKISFTQGNNSQSSWKYNNADSSYQLAEPEKNKSQSFIEHWTGDLIKYKTGEITGKLLDIVNIDGVDAYKLELRKNKKIRIYYIDKLSYLLLRVDIPANKESTYYMNYQKTGGFLLPFKMDGYSNNLLQMSIEMDTVKINTTIDEKIFQSPEK